MRRAPLCADQSRRRDGWANGDNRRDSGRVRTWTVEEARAYLPRLRQLLGLIDAALVPGPEPGTYALASGSEHAEAALEELQEGDVVLRQVERGLVDFPWRGPDGELRLLCYQVNEPDLAFWHRPEDGFAGRRPIDDVTWPAASPDRGGSP
jgi:hypothetical protein